MRDVRRQLVQRGQPERVDGWIHSPASASSWAAAVMATSLGTGRCSSGTLTYFLMYFAVSFTASCRKRNSNLSSYAFASVDFTSADMSQNCCLKGPRAFLRVL